MKEYKIERWDAILLADNRYPIIYITPDKDLKNFLDQNDYFIKIKIRGTGNIYDNRLMKAKVNLSSNYPNYRPNYFEQTGQFVLTLDSCWAGYPEPAKLGYVSFYSYF